MIIVMIDILSWEIDWICLGKRDTTKIYTNKMIFYGMQQVTYAQPVLRLHSYMFFFQITKAVQ